VEFAEIGNFHESSPNCSVEQLCRFTIQAATALEHLEKNKVIHRALEEYNFLVVAKDQVRSPQLESCFQSVKMASFINVLLKEQCHQCHFLFLSKICLPCRKHDLLPDQQQHDVKRFFERKNEPKSVLTDVQERKERNTLYIPYYTINRKLTLVLIKVSEINAT